MAIRKPAMTGTVAIVAGVVGTTALLRRMRAELTEAGRLSPSTVAWMYVTYGAHAIATSVALIRRSGHLPLPRPVSVAGGVAALAGAGLGLAGMMRFGGAGQLSGTETGSLLGSGVYRYSRNPQYAGLVTGMIGLALARRSGLALTLAAGIAAAYRWWVPVEEHHLDRTFGPTYRTYRDHTSRWLGLPAT